LKSEKIAPATYEEVGHQRRDRRTTVFMTEVITMAARRRQGRQGRGWTGNCTQIGQM